MKKLLLTLGMVLIALSLSAQSTFRSDIIMQKSAPVFHLNGTGAVINFYNGDVMITHSSNKISISGGGLDVQAGQLIRLGTDTVTVRSYVRDRIGDSINDLKTRAVRLSSLALMHRDTLSKTQLATSLGIATKDDLTQLELGSGGSAVSRLIFTVGTTPGAPSAGSSTVANIPGLINKHLAVYRAMYPSQVMALQYESTTNGVQYNPTTGVVTFYPGFSTGDRVEIHATSPTSWTNLAFSASSLLSSGLIGFWNMNESSGVRDDATPNNIDLSPEGTIGSATGKIGTAVNFTDRYTRLASQNLAALNPSGDQYTVAFWIYLNSLPSANARDMYLFSANLDENSTFQIFINTSNFIRMRMIESTGILRDFPHATAVVAGQWLCIVASVRGTGTYMRMWKNNVGSSDNELQQNPIMNALVNYTIGNYKDPSGGALDGRMDMLGIWRRAFTQEDYDLFYFGGLGMEYPFPQ